MSDAFQDSFVSSLVPVPPVPCLMLALLPPSPWICYLTVTLLFENLLTEKGNLLISCTKAFTVKASV